MRVSTLCVIVNAITISTIFGLWQQSFLAFLFFLVLWGGVLSLIDYAKQPPK